MMCDRFELILGDADYSVAGQGVDWKCAQIVFGDVGEHSVVVHGTARE